MRVLRARVRVREPVSGRSVFVGPGVCPDWAVPLVTSPRAWVDAPEPERPESVEFEAEQVRPAYATLTVAELKAEISDRNIGRDLADRIPTDGNKAALVAGLETDDQT